MEETENNYVMSARQAAELDLALERNGLTPSDVARLAKGDVLSQVRLVLYGKAEIVTRKYVIDLDADPYIPYPGWEVTKNIKGGQFEWDPSKENLLLQPYKWERRFKAGQSGCLVMNSRAFVFFYEHPLLIPDVYKDKNLYFEGTIYRREDGNLYVLHLNWSGSVWVKDFARLNFI